MFQLIIGEQHLLRLLFESRKLRLLFKIWQKKRKRTVFSARRYKADGSTPSSGTGSDKSVHKFLKSVNKRHQAAA